MLSDRKASHFRNLNSTVPIDVVRVKSYVNSLFDSSGVPVRVSFNRPRADNVRFYWHIQKRLEFEFVKAVYPYRAL